MRFGAAAPLLLLAWSAGALAHSRGTSYSEWTLTAQGAEVRARIPQLELTRLSLVPDQPGYAEAVGATLAEGLQFWAGAARCEATTPDTRAAGDGWIYARWSLRCASAQDRVIRSTLFQAVAPSHLHFARVQTEDGEVRERVLTYAEPAFALGAPAEAGGSLLRYARLGVEHILSGWDHLAFVLALILLAASLAEVALVATGFTVAHSFTLAAAVLGWIDVRGAAVEALIGFSIALVAAENLWLRAGRERWLPALTAAALVALGLAGVTRLPFALLVGLALFTACYFALAREAAKPLRLRIAVAFLFGLAHGFGFAGALAPLRLPQEQLVTGLFGFNAGVELGQLLVIALAWPVLRWLGRRPQARAWAGDAVSACLCALGVFWFVMRTFG